jgi:hypothetical protein
VQRTAREQIDRGECGHERERHRCLFAPAVQPWRDQHLFRQVAQSGECKQGNIA